MASKNYYNYIITIIIIYICVPIDYSSMADVAETII